MLTSYALLHAPPRPNRSTCTLADGGRPGRLTHAAAARPPLRTLTLTLTLVLTLTLALTLALTLNLTLRPSPGMLRQSRCGPTRLTPW